MMYVCVCLYVVVMYARTHTSVGSRRVFCCSHGAHRYALGWLGGDARALEPTHKTRCASVSELRLYVVRPHGTFS